MSYPDHTALDTKLVYTVLRIFVLIILISPLHAISSEIEMLVNVLFCLSVRFGLQKLKRFH